MKKFGPNNERCEAAFYPPGKSFLSETFGIEPHNVVAEIGQYL